MVYLQKSFIDFLFIVMENGNGFFNSILSVYINTMQRLKIISAMIKNFKSLFIFSLPFIIKRGFLLSRYLKEMWIGVLRMFYVCIGLGEPKFNIIFCYISIFLLILWKVYYRQITHLYKKDNKRFSQVNRGILSKNKISSFETPQGVTNKRYYSNFSKSDVVDKRLVFIRKKK